VFIGVERRPDWIFGTLLAPRSAHGIFICLAPVLEGIRVLDLSSIVAGPTASMILSDLGADIIKVERAGGGEDGRAMGPHRGEWGAYFVALNRGKRSITLDLAKPEGREVVLRLASTCDVFLENFRGGKAAALGLDEPAVRARKPDIIYASLSAYGPGGPDYTKPGYDAVLQARTGIMSVTGTGDGHPMRTGVSILDVTTGTWMALGILAALLERKSSGQGQRVDASLFQTGILFMAYHLVYRQFTGVDPQPQGARHKAFAPYGSLPTGDGQIMLGISSDKQFHRLCVALGHEEWASDPRFCANTGRVANVDELENLIGAVLRTHPTSHWVALLDERDLANDPIQSPGQVLNDPQAAALQLFAQINLTGEQSVVLPRLPIGLSLTPPAPQGPPPSVGEHGRSILHEAGYSDPEIEELVRVGACGIPGDRV
jgi:crotonobetainyl-CoA:carnitine CoA-transferase CaiB-like acyl-CoA transferase